MSDLSYMIWFLATAAMTITVLTVGTLAAAEMLPGGQYSRRRTGPRARERRRALGARRRNPKASTARGRPRSAERRDRWRKELP
jgi:hypothetical protein